VARGKILAVDYGSQNVGLASSDALGVTVRPLASLPNGGRKELLEQLRRIVEEYEIAEVVVGMPWNMDGSAGPAAQHARRLVSQIERELGLPVHSFDERLSSVEAEEEWRVLGRRQRQRYRTADSLAAALILERFLSHAEQPAAGGAPKGGRG